MSAVHTRMAAVVPPVVPFVQKLAGEHPGTLSLAQGMVFFGPPNALLERVLTRLLPDDARYGAVEGDRSLREAYAAHLTALHGYPQAGLADRLYMVSGANAGFLQAILCLSAPDDEVILFEPFYFNHEMAIRIAGCTPRVLPRSALDEPDLATLNAAIGPRTRAVVTVSPNNPTGETLTRETLERVNQFAATRGIFHISDEAYDELVFGDIPHTAPAARLGADAHTIAIYSMSKSFGMAGFRLGCVVLPERLKDDFCKVGDTNLICPARAVQRVGTTLLEQWQSERRALIARVGEQRATLCERLAARLPHMLDYPSTGALYLWLPLPAGVDPMQATRELIAQEGVAVLPGSAFHVEGSETSPPRIRVSFGGVSGRDFTRACDRLLTGLERLHEAAAPEPIHISGNL